MAQGWRYLLLLFFIFTIVTPDSAFALLSAPTLSSPTNGATGISTTPTFSWSSVSGANKYWLMVATSSSVFPTDVNASSCSSFIISVNTTSTSQTSGLSPLSTNLSADISGTATGSINYTFWWNCTNTGTSVSSVTSVCGDPWNSTYGAKFDGVTDDPKTVSHTYSSAGTYTAKVIVERGSALPVEAQVTITVTTDSSKPTIVADSDSRDLGTSGRIPLILIHGIHGNKWPYGEYKDKDDISVPYPHYFQNLINALYDNGLTSKYKIYRFHYMSDILSVKDIAQGLKENIDLLIQNGQLENRSFVIVAHSMGGLVARSYMNEQGGGDRVLQLITLATPHHGSPISNNKPRVDESFSSLGWDSVINAADKFAWMRSSSLWGGISCGLLDLVLDVNCVVDEYEFNRSDLRWDNFNGMWDNVSDYTGNYSTEKNDWLINLPSTYDQKVTAYWGYIGDGDSFDVNDLGKMSPGEIAEAVIGRKLLIDDNYKMSTQYGDYYYNEATSYEHLGLNAVGLFLQRIYEPNFSTVISYLDNDGMVPKQSAAFDNHTIYKQVECPNHDHLDMKDGNATTCNNDLTLLNSVSSDLSDIWNDAQPKVDAFSVSSKSINLGDTITFPFKVSDNSGSGLNSVELWRADDNDGSPGTWEKRGSISVSGNGPMTGSFNDTPSQTGSYWYGIHVVNNAGNW